MHKKHGRSAFMASLNALRFEGPQPVIEGCGSRSPHMSRSTTSAVSLYVRESNVVAQGSTTTCDIHAAVCPLRLSNTPGRAGESVKPRGRCRARERKVYGGMSDIKAQKASLYRRRSSDTRAQPRTAVLVYSSYARDCAVMNTAHSKL